MERLARLGPRLAVFILIAASAISAWILVRHGAIGPTTIHDALAHNRLAVPVFILLQIVASLTFIPRLILGVAAGLIFGFAWGAVWAILGAEAGAAVGFALWRWIGAGAIDLKATAKRRRIADIARQSAELAEKGGWRAVAITRLMPLPHSFVNIALALTKVGWVDYLVGSLIGMLPMTLLQVDIGAAGGKLLQGDGAWLAASLLLALGLAGSFLMKRLASRRL